MIHTSSINGSPEMKDEMLAMAIEGITHTGEDGKQWRHYSVEFDARRDPQDEGSCQVENVFTASWPVADGEPKWKHIIRRIFKLP